MLKDPIKLAPTRPPPPPPGKRFTSNQLVIAVVAAWLLAMAFVLAWMIIG